MKKFLVNGRELETYQMSNSELLNLVRSGNSLSQEDMDYLTNKILNRFEQECCPSDGENEDNVFVRQFSNFVNGKIHSKKETATLMCREHRYLQSEMFKVCLEYIKALANNAKQGIYDGRNEWAAKTSEAIIRLLDENNINY